MRVVLLGNFDTCKWKHGGHRPPLQPRVVLLGNSDACKEAALKRRKQVVLDFIRHGWFADVQAPK